MPRTHKLEDYRNFGIMAHIDAGKTTTTERVLYLLGQVAQDRRSPRWRGHDGLDGTGARARHHDHVRCDDLLLAGQAPEHHRHARTRRLHDRSRAQSLRVLDGAVAVLDGNQGVEPQTETVWRQADKYNVPRIVFANKMDKIGADFYNCVNDLVKRLGVKPVPLQLPIGIEHTFKGVVDLVEMRGIVWHDESLGAKYDIVADPGRHGRAGAGIPRQADRSRRRTR